MKKLLGLIGAIGLTASAVATGVAMSPVQTIKTETNEISNKNFSSDNIENFVNAQYIGKHIVVRINVTNCNILKNWSWVAKYDWARRSGYIKEVAVAIADVHPVIFSWGATHGGLVLEFDI